MQVVFDRPLQEVPATMFKHILITHDLSRESDLALQRAVALAHGYGARLTLLHVLEDHLPSTLQESLRDSAQKLFQQRLEQLGALDAQVLLRKGRPALQILEEVEESGADLLVIGNHHHNAPELFIGTTLERVTRHVAIPVLLVVGEKPEPYRSGVVALDFSLCACDALRAACSLLGAEGRLTAVNVMELTGRLLAKAGTAGDYVGTQHGLLERLLADELGHVKDTPSIDLQVTQGALPRALDERIAAAKPQFIALGSHSRSMVAQALLGSQALHLLQRPPCDVLIVK